MSIYAAIMGSALADGIFTGYYLRTGTDASPSALGIRIINQIVSLFPVTTTPYVESYKFLILVSPWILTLLPWLFTAVTIFIAPSKKLGLFIYGGLFIASTLFVGYYNA